MNSELDAALCRKYPGFFRYRTVSSDKSLMSRGFSCEDGWFTLIDVISELLTKHNPDVFAIHIKEKLGSLIFCNSDTSDYSVGVEMAADRVSKYVCEICGALGVLNHNENGWLATRCDEHKSENSATDNCDLDLSDVANLKMGKAWSRLAAILQELADWFTAHNRMPAAYFFINIDKKGQLNIQYSRGNEITRGMVDLIVGYANRIDQDSGRPKDI
ncbi:hypothetical protein IVG45_17170 [Methylomonas sp. LL1]|uniref:hypothetical protein n=1 Tax=Methylomonas sp. LL1 TaxID=2785785 RepID=UPI0018C35CF9|nr:hypothetical protein [Methylomonas sp. LL1]QPK62564.1 hypothetical protein IVG45_17170 [Methylomonas sp. LL1]